MIKEHQPTIFKDLVMVKVSSVDDGNMGFMYGEEIDVKTNVQRFLTNCQLDSNKITKFSTDYDKIDFCQFKIAQDTEAGAGIIDRRIILADGMVTNNSEQGLFFIVGDCCVVTLFDPIKRVLMLVHQGRHTAEQYGVLKAVQFLETEFKVEPANLLVWLSPAVGVKTYPVFKRDNLGLRQIAKQDLLTVGVKSGNIEICPVDTASDQRYFSHSQYIKGNRLKDGRFAVVAMMK